MDLDANMVPTSPSADSSPSSSDLDTEVEVLDFPVGWPCVSDVFFSLLALTMVASQSTGSFFPDRSTTLGTLMGVSTFGGQRRALGAAAAQEEERDRAQRAAREEETGRRGGVWRRRGRSLGGSWWRLCRDDGGVGSAPTSLGEFLDMERQLAGADFLCDDGAGGSGREHAAATALFEADGRVRPPQQQPTAAASEERARWRLLRAPERSTMARLPVLLTGICNGGAG
jgi:hypothetical protein